MMKHKLIKKNLKKILYYCFFVLIFCFFILNLLKSYAFEMESSQYQIDFSNINITSGNKSSASYKLSDTVGQTAAGQFQSSGYVIKAGFQYIHSIIPFRFTISNTQINFGTVIPSNPVTKNTILTVTFGQSGSYQVTAIEEGPMKTLNEGYYIPDTSCDGGNNTCSESVAKSWTSTAAYGFGYNMSGQDIPTDFIDSNYYRPFPDRLQNESPAVVMFSNNIGINRQATVTFKLNVSPLQPGGNYQTIINFAAIPSF